MSSLQDKMYNHEVTPPANAWDKIAAALDESETENKFPSKLYNSEINPPAEVWSAIATTLDQNENQYAFPARLYNLEIDPPAGTWNKIDSSLHTPAETVVPVRRLHPFFRYAVAALFIGAVAYGIIMTVNNNDDDSNTAATIIKDSNNSAKKTPAATAPIQATILPQVDDMLDKARNLVARVDRKKTNRRITPSFVSHAVDDVTIDANLSQSIYAYADHVPDIADRYVMLMTPDGNIIRMSKKWSDLLCCVSGEDQDAGCKNQLKKWQEKIAASSLAPSPGNFMDILGLVSSLDETNGL
jgi:hypothetical protein